VRKLTRLRFGCALENALARANQFVTYEASDTTIARHGFEVFKKQVQASPRTRALTARNRGPVIRSAIVATTWSRLGTRFDSRNSVQYGSARHFGGIIVGFEQQVVVAACDDVDQKLAVSNLLRRQLCLVEYLTGQWLKADFRAGRSPAVNARSELPVVQKERIEAWSVIG